MNPTIRGVIGPGFVHQVPTLPIASIVAPFLWLPHRIPNVELVYITPNRNCDGDYSCVYIYTHMYDVFEGLAGVLQEKYRTSGTEISHKGREKSSDLARQDPQSDLLPEGSRDSYYKAFGPQDHAL